MAGPVAAAATSPEHRAVERQDDDGGGTVVQGDGLDDCVTGERLGGNEIAGGLVGVNCGTSGNQSTVSFYGDGGFAYLVVIEVPADAPSEGVATEAGSYARHESPARSDAELDRIWGQAEPLMSDEVGMTAQTPVTFQSTAFGITEELPPGFYNARVVAYEPTDGSGSSEPSGPVAAREQVPRHSSTLRLEVGDCSIDPSPEAKLERLDRRKLELIEDIAQLRDLYSRARVDFTAGTAAATVSFSYEVLTGAKAIAKKGAEEGLKAAATEAAERGGKGAESQLMTDAPTPPSPHGLADIKEQFTDPAWERRNEVINRYHARTKELKQVNREYSRTVERIRRCAGVTVPPGYQGITASERQRAKALNGWPYDDGKESNPYEDLGGPARYDEVAAHEADGGR